MADLAFPVARIDGFLRLWRENKRLKREQQESERDHLAAHTGSALPISWGCQQAYERGRCWPESTSRAAIFAISLIGSSSLSAGWARAAADLVGPEGPEKPKTAQRRRP